MTSVPFPLMLDFLIELVEHAREDNSDRYPLPFIGVMSEHDNAEYDSHDHPCCGNKGEDVLLEVCYDVVNAYLANQLQQTNNYNIFKCSWVGEDEFEGGEQGAVDSEGVEETEDEGVEVCYCKQLIGSGLEERFRISLTVRKQCIRQHRYTQQQKAKPLQLGIMFVDLVFVGLCEKLVTSLAKLKPMTPTVIMIAMRSLCLPRIRWVLVFFTLEKKAPMITTNRNLTLLPMTCTGQEIYRRDECVVTMLIVKSPPIISRYLMLIGLAGYDLTREMTYPAREQKRQLSQTIRGAYVNLAGGSLEFVDLYQVLQLGGARSTDARREGTW